jgi:hypothetical protein
MRIREKGKKVTTHQKLGKNFLAKNNRFTKSGSEERLRDLENVGRLGPIYAQKKKWKVQSRHSRPKLKLISFRPQQKAAKRASLVSSFARQIPK